MQDNDIKKIYVDERKNKTKKIIELKLNSFATILIFSAYGETYRLKVYSLVNILKIGTKASSLHEELYAFQQHYRTSEIFFEYKMLSIL